MNAKPLVVDANILIRGVLGERVRSIFAEFGEDVQFVIPDRAYGEAEEHLAKLVQTREPC